MEIIVEIGMTDVKATKDIFNMGQNSQVSGLGFARQDRFGKNWVKSHIPVHSSPSIKNKFEEGHSLSCETE